MIKTKHQSKKKQQVSKPRQAPKPNVDKLAETFEIDFKKIVPIIPLPDGSVVYKDFVTKQTKDGRWVLLRKNTLGTHGEFNLKTSALIAAKALSLVHIDKYNEIKMLDSRYWANHYTVQVCKKHLPNIKDLDHYMIMLNKYEHSLWLEEHCKEEISKMFRWSFV